MKPGLSGLAQIKGRNALQWEDKFRFDLQYVEKISFKMDVLIKYIGDVGNGYYQTINQIISYVFLAQAGFSDAVIYSLYKPFAEKNKDDINAIYGGARKVFRIIGFIILGIIFLVTLGLHLFYNFEEGYKVSALICFFIISIFKSFIKLRQRTSSHLFGLPVSLSSSYSK